VNGAGHDSPDTKRLRGVPSHRQLVGPPADGAWPAAMWAAATGRLTSTPPRTTTRRTIR
jgi:hypothetical protein